MRKKINTPTLKARDIVERCAVGPSFQLVYGIAPSPQVTVTAYQVLPSNNGATTCLGYTEDNRLYSLTEYNHVLEERMLYSLGCDLGQALQQSVGHYMACVAGPQQLAWALRPNDLVTLADFDGRPRHYAVRLRRRAWRCVVTLTPDGPSARGYAAVNLTGYNLDGTPLEI